MTSFPDFDQVLELRGQDVLEVGGERVVGREVLRNGGHGWIV